MFIRGYRILALKKDLRKQVLDSRFKLSPDDRRAKSRKIEERLFSLPEFRDASTVLFYASFRSEVETWQMIRRALDEGKRVVLPRVKGRELALFAIQDFDRDVAPGAWDIPEPVRGTPTKIGEIDLVIMPGAVFDEQGNRLGYGAGFYDRLLEGYSGMSVAFAYEMQIVPEVAVSPHDIPVKKIVTEKRIIEAKS